MPEPQLKLPRLLDQIIQDDALHCRWLNTLSMMENIGAMKIVNSEHPRSVDEQVLKHAAEETRHAYYLKRQIKKITPGACTSYAPEYLVNPRLSYQYLYLLDTRISRLLRDKLSLHGNTLKKHAYVLVTYAIEVRADILYALYQRLLKAHKSPVSVRGIIAEEEQHLAEMEASIDALFADADHWRKRVIEIEHAMFAEWMDGLQQSISLQLTAA